MTTWDDYKNHVRETNPEIGKDIDEVEAVSRTADGGWIRPAMEKAGLEDTDALLTASRNLPPSRRIIRNAIRCNHCGDVIESTYRHNFVTCRCGRVSVDGGHDYLRRCGDPSDYTDLSEIEGGE